MIINFLHVVNVLSQKPFQVKFTNFRAATHVLPQVLPFNELWIAELDCEHWLASFCGGGFSVLGVHTQSSFLLLPSLKDEEPWSMKGAFFSSEQCSDPSIISRTAWNFRDSKWGTAVQSFSMLTKYVFLSRFCGSALHLTSDPHWSLAENQYKTKRRLMVSRSSTPILGSRWCICVQKGNCERKEFKQRYA